MARLRRRWRVVKWIGAAISTFIAVAWAVSLPWYWAWGRQTYVREPLFVDVEMNRGVIWVNWCRGVVVSHYSDFTMPQPNTVWYNVSRRTYFVDPKYDHFAGRCVQLVPEGGFYANSRGWYVRLPLWIPLVLCAVPTGLIFWRDRRIPHHSCQGCGYDLTGNTIGVCPECGEQI